MTAYILFEIITRCLVRLGRKCLILSCAFLRLFPTVSVPTVTSNPQSSAPVPLPKKTRNLFGRHSQMIIISPYLISIFNYHFRYDRHGSYRGQCRANFPNSGRTRERRPSSSKKHQRLLSLLLFKRRQES